MCHVSCVVCEGRREKRKKFRYVDGDCEARVRIPKNSSTGMCGKEGAHGSSSLCRRGIGVCVRYYVRDEEMREVEG